MQKVFLKVVGALIDTPDARIGYARMEHIKKGWVVRKRDATNFEGEQGMAQAVNIALETTKAISGYKDGDVELWDVIFVVDTEMEATTLGKLNGQMSIYQIETGKLNWIW